MTAEEREAVAAALERMGEKASDELLAAWRKAAEQAGDWATAALERGRAAGEEKARQDAELERAIRAGEVILLE